MELNNIEKLLEKYHAGDTSLQEEQALKNYFSQETIAPHLEIYKPLFSYFAINQQEKYSKNLPLNTAQKGLHTTMIYKIFSVAAVISILVGFYYKFTIKSTEDLGTIENPELAFLEVKKSLEMISTHFNKGASSINYLNEVENTTSLIFKK